MTTHPAITTTTSTDQDEEPGQEQETRTRPLPNTDHYAEQTTRHEQQDPGTERSRERSEGAHLGITIRGPGPASGRPEGPFTADAVAETPLLILPRSSGC
jgi:hypothetical protein